MGLKCFRVYMGCSSIRFSYSEQRAHSLTFIYLCAVFYYWKYIQDSEKNFVQFPRGVFKEELDVQ